MPGLNDQDGGLVQVAAPVVFFPIWWRRVSIRKSCEKACRWSAWRFAVATPVTALLMRVLSGRGRLCPGAEVLLARVPRQEPFQRRAGEWLPAVAAALVEVSGE